MKTWKLYPLELGRLLQSRLTWLMMGFDSSLPVLGLVLYKPAYPPPCSPCIWQTPRLPAVWPRHPLRPADHL